MGGRITIVDPGCPPAGGGDTGRRIGGGSCDAVSGSLAAPGGLLDFFIKPHFTPVILSPATGEVVSG